MPTLASSAIANAEYDGGRLYITFSSGGTYTFYRVPPYIYEGLINASSPGEYYHHFIRGRFGL